MTEKKDALTSAQTSTQIAMGNWEPKNTLITCENFDRFKFMYPQYEHHVTIEKAERHFQADKALVRLLVKNYDKENEIERLVYHYNGFSRESRECIEIELEGEGQQEITVGLVIHFADGVTKDHSFKVWYFPIKEYEARGLTADASRIVAEKSSIPFQAPALDHSIHDWNSASYRHKEMLEKLCDELPQTIASSAMGTSERIQALFHFLNFELHKGFSNIHPRDMEPVDIIRAGCKKPLTHFCLNVLATLLLYAMGIPARMIMKRGIDFGTNFALEGDGYALEYYDREKNKFVLCSPWLNILFLRFARDYYLDLFDFTHFIRMDKTDQLELRVFDSAAGVFMMLDAERRGQYDIGFENHYALDFPNAVEHLAHNINTGSLEFWSVKALMEKYYP